MRRLSLQVNACKYKVNTHISVDKNRWSRSQYSMNELKMPLNHHTLKNTKPSHYGLHTLQGRLHFTPLIQQNKACGVNTPSDLDLPFFYPLLLV